jgi:hypothetical protein
MKQKKSICIISFSPIYRDARVLRQIKYLSPYYNLTIIGYGDPCPDWADKENINWLSLEFSPPSIYEKSKMTKKINGYQFLKSHIFKNLFISIFYPFLKKIKILITYSLLGLGRFSTKFYEFWYWRQKYHIKAFRFAVKSNSHAFHANDWEALPVAVRAAQSNHAKVIFDAHEYAPLELENRWYWKPFFQPAITYFLKKYSPKIDASITVATAISKRYKEEYGFNSEVILNAPERENLPERILNINKICLVHHGGAIRDRKLENLIETLKLCDERFNLHLILLKNDLYYLKKLKKLAEKLAPGRVIFHDPVSPEKIVKRISEYDIGLCLISPTNFNYLISLPNKFFDYMMAGLAICIGPSPSMAEIIFKYDIGCVAPSFDPCDVAETLNRITIHDLLRMKSASREVAKLINAENEMKKLLNIYKQLINQNSKYIKNTF